MPAARFPFADQVRAVLFDAGNTLLWIDHARMAQVATAAGLPCDAAAVRGAEMRARPDLDPYLRSVSKREGTHSARRYADAVLARLTAPAGGAVAVGAEVGAEVCAAVAAVADADTAAAVAAVADAWLAVWSTLWVVPPADAHATLDALHARGLRLGCVSNSNGRVRQLLADAGLAPRLECVVDSGVEGVEKPDPRIFRIAADRLALDPAACVYVGDFLSLDVHGAHAAGMHAVLMDPIGAWGDVGAPRIAALAELPERL